MKLEPLRVLRHYTVGHLADRITGNHFAPKPLPKLPAFTRDQLKNMQKNLNQLGFDVGKPDGIMGISSPQRRA